MLDLGHILEAKDHKLGFAKDNKKSGIVSYYFGHGKLMLTGEYLVMHGAKALSLPTNLGQSLVVKSVKTFNSPIVNWKSYDYKENVWFECQFDCKKFDILETNDSSKSEFLKTLLLKSRELNIHFLRDEYVYNVETRLDFPIDWGLGSSSTLIYNIAQWAYVSPFELADTTFGGSGYDIACAQSQSPIIFSRDSGMPEWELISYRPEFLDKLYFVHLDQKINTRDEIKRFHSLNISDEKRRSSVLKINEITDKIYKSQSLDQFSMFLNLLKNHESIISEYLGYEIVQNRLFPDYPGVIKSMGAWGGDFVLAASDHFNKDQTLEYFHGLGHNTVISYKDLICDFGQRVSVLGNLKH